MTRRSRRLCTYNYFHKASSGNLLCLLPEVLSDCSSPSVYCCGDDFSIINSTKWTPAFCKPASGEHSDCFSLQLLTGIQQTEASFPLFSTLQARSLPEWNALDSFQMFCISIFEFPAFLQCILSACKKLNTVLLLTELM